MPTDAEMLKAYLAERDVACPGCGYSLKGCASDRCPECGQGIVIGVWRQPWLLRWKRPISVATWSLFAFYFTEWFWLVRDFVRSWPFALSSLIDGWWSILRVSYLLALAIGTWLLVHALILLHARRDAPVARIERSFGLFLPFGSLLLVFRVTWEWLARFLF